MHVTKPGASVQRDYIYYYIRARALRGTRFRRPGNSLGPGAGGRPKRNRDEKKKKNAPTKQNIITIYIGTRTENSTDVAAYKYSRRRRLSRARSYARYGRIPRL